MFKVFYIFEKVINNVEKGNIIVFKVVLDVNKVEIVNVVEVFFEVKVDFVCIVVVKGKIKCYGVKLGCCSDWKKVYVIF